MTKDAKKYHGLYQGVVASNLDQLRSGRLLVRVPDVLGDDPCIWADPATPLAGPASGMYVVPLVGSGVWVQFADGDPDRAVWTGFWRGSAEELPPAAQAAPGGVPQVVIGTPAQSCLLISDLAGPTGGILLQLKGPAGPYIRLYEGGIEIGASASGPTIKVTQAGIDLGNGALTVLPG
ncbi:phage baseplate assembly protein V [Streptomyces sp. AB3(2024)]|uniref:phage baseplate assembly protein V n=1 Tax=Streptomyces sp. AB3(2024) TaxID=3317321 RepID=UPI0035A35D0E